MTICRRDVEFASNPGLSTPECLRIAVQGLTAESRAHASNTRRQILHKNRKAHIRRVHFIPGRAPLVAPDEIEGKHGFNSPRTLSDDGRLTGLEILPQDVEQPLPAGAISDFQRSRIAQRPYVQLPRDLESRGDRRLSSGALAGSTFLGWKLRRCDRLPARSQMASRPGEISFWGNFATTVRHEPNRPAFRIAAILLR